MSLFATNTCAFSPVWGTIVRMVSPERMTPSTRAFGSNTIPDAGAITFDISTLIQLA